MHLDVLTHQGLMGSTSDLCDVDQARKEAAKAQMILYEDNSMDFQVQGKYAGLA